VLIPEGEFLAGGSGSDEGGGKPFAVRLPAYYLALHPVTNAQYISLLNAVARQSDPQGLYSTQMSSTVGGISRIGSGPYSYWVNGGDTNWLNRPVNCVTWYGALRFCNWLQNGQPTSGVEDASTTENGAYDMSLGTNVIREVGAKYFLPTENEWYKAAYYDPNKPGGAGYWTYPTRSDITPQSELAPGTDLVNGSANYRVTSLLDPVYRSTPVGAYTAKPSTSAYGTFDQGGNVWEWTESVFDYGKCVRGGSCNSYYDNMMAGARIHGVPQNEDWSTGFRVAASTPEPSTFVLLGMGAFGLLAYAWPRRRAM